MKTKHILTAMALPAMLAACTADEIVENNNVAVKRTEVSAVSFAAENTGSRLAYNEETMNWDWEGTDKFLLLQADGGYFDTTEDALPGKRFSAGAPSTGYEYEKTENGYETKAAVMEEGLYWGYAPSFNKTYKGYVKYELPTAQYMHVDGKQDTYSDVKLATLITPLYEVSALNEGEFYNNLPLEMINFYSTLVMPLKNSTDEDITINQIVFESNTDLVVSGRINTNKLADYIIASDGEEWAPAQNFDEDDENDKTMAEFLDDMRKEDLIVTYSKDAGDKQSKTIVLNLDGYVLEAGKTEEFYMLVPASKGAINYTIAIVAEEGLVEIKSSDVSNAMESTKIYHNAQKAAFGRTNKGVARSFVIDESDFTEMGEAYYVTSYDEMERILDEDVNGTISVYNVGDWGLDENLVSAIEKSDAFVIFKNEIELEGAALTAEEALELTKVAFEKSVTVVEDTKVNFNLSDYLPAAVKSKAAPTKKEANVTKLIVSEGAEVTLNNGNFNEIVNEGTLNVNSGATMTSADITTSGVLNLKDKNDGTVKLVAGTLNYKTAKTAAQGGWKTTNSNLTLGAFIGNAEIIVGANVSLTHKMAAINEWYQNDATTGLLKYALSVTNNGKIELVGNDVKGDLNIYGSLTNNGEIVKGGTLRLYGESTNAAGATIETTAFVNYGTLTNNGNLFAEATAIHGNSNYGTIITGNKSKTYIDANSDATTTKVGRINNTAEEKVVIGSGIKQVVYVEFEDVTAQELTEIDYYTYAINTVKVTGELTIAKDFVDYFTTENPALDMNNNNVNDIYECLTTLELGNLASVDVRTNVAAVANISKVVLYGNATISGWDKANSSLTLNNSELVFEVHEFAASSSTADGYVLKLDNIVFNANPTVEIVKTATSSQYSIPTIVKNVESTWANTPAGNKFVAQ